MTMVQAYDKDQFERDKQEMAEWLNENWQYDSKWMTYLGNMLSAIKSLIEDWKRE